MIVRVLRDIEKASSERRTVHLVYRKLALQRIPCNVRKHQKANVNSDS